MKIPLLIAGSPNGEFPMVKLHKGNWKIVCSDPTCDLLVSFSTKEADMPNAICHAINGAIIEGPKHVRVTMISKPCSIHAELQL